MIKPVASFKDEEAMEEYQRWQLDRSKQPVSDVIYGGNVSGLGSPYIDKLLEESAMLASNVIPADRWWLTDEEESAMVDEISGIEQPVDGDGILDSRPLKSPVLYQHLRRGCYSEDKSDIIHALKGGATIAYDYHASDDTVDIAYGYAICADTDCFCKERGRTLAHRRLVNLTEMSGCVTIPLKPRLSPSDVRDYVGGFVRKLLELLWSQQRC